MSRGGGGGGGVRRRRAAGYGGGARALEMNSPPQSKMISSCSLASAQEYALEALELLAYEGERGVAAACCAAAATTSNRGSSIAAARKHVRFLVSFDSAPRLVPRAVLVPYPGVACADRWGVAQVSPLYTQCPWVQPRDEGKVATARCHCSARRGRSQCRVTLTPSLRTPRPASSH